MEKNSKLNNRRWWVEGDDYSVLESSWLGVYCKVLLFTCCVARYALVLIHYSLLIAKSHATICKFPCRHTTSFQSRHDVVSKLKQRHVSTGSFGTCYLLLTLQQLIAENDRYKYRLLPVSKFTLKNFLR